MTDTGKRFDDLAAWRDLDDCGREAVGRAALLVALALLGQDQAIQRAFDGPPPLDSSRLHCFLALESRSLDQLAAACALWLPDLRKDAPLPPTTPGVCRNCGCTEDRACVRRDGVACHWVEPDLCSGCAPKDPQA